MFSRHLSNRANRIVVLAGALAVACTIFSPTASAQTWDKATTVTFNQPIEIPGVNVQVLPAGTYIFRLLDAQADRHIVQVFSGDGSHLYANILAIPNYRLQATNETVMTFAERAVGSPKAIRAWFYPGDNSGQEFVYPKTKAVELAKITNVPVLYIPDEVAPNIVAPVKTAAEPPVIALREVPVMAVTPRGEVVRIAEVVVPPPVQIAAAQPRVETAEVVVPQLPKTATDLPLLALMGFLCLGAAVSLRVLCAR